MSGEIRTANNGGAVGDAGRADAGKPSRHWWRYWGGVGAATGLIVVNVVYFLGSFLRYLDANQDSGHLIDIMFVQDKVAITLWWQIIANGVFLVAFRRTRRIGLALLITGALAFLFFVLVMLSIADQMGD